MTVVKRNRGALLAQRSLPRRRLDHVWASGHNHAWQALRFLWERKLAQRRLRGRVPSWHRVPCEGPEAQQIWDALSLSDGILNASTTRRDGSSNDRHRPSKRGQRDGRQAESRCAAGTAFTPASTSCSRRGMRPRTKRGRLLALKTISLIDNHALAVFNVLTLPGLLAPERIRRAMPPQGAWLQQGLYPRIRCACART